MFYFGNFIVRVYSAFDMWRSIRSLTIEWYTSFSSEQQSDDTLIRTSDDIQMSWWVKMNVKFF